MLGKLSPLKPGPFKIIEDEGNGDVERPIMPPRRRHSCSNYCTCLDLAAALNWDNFTCRGCCGEINETLMWQAMNKQRHDSIAHDICAIPQPHAIEGSTRTSPSVTLKEIRESGEVENDDRKIGLRSIDLPRRT